MKLKYFYDTEFMDATRKPATDDEHNALADHAGTFSSRTSWASSDRAAGGARWGLLLRRDPLRTSPAMDQTTLPSLTPILDQLIYEARHGGIRVSTCADEYATNPGEVLTCAEEPGHDYGQHSTPHRDRTRHVTW